MIPSYLKIEILAKGDLYVQLVPKGSKEIAMVVVASEQKYFFVVIANTPENQSKLSDEKTN